MAQQVPVDVVRRSLLTLLDEITLHVKEYVLDEGTSLFETLAGISAEEAPEVDYG